MGCVSLKNASDRAAEDLSQFNHSLQWGTISTVRPAVHRRLAETERGSQRRKSAFEVPTCGTDQELGEPVRRPRAAIEVRIV
jgi:hypothetical protein